MVSGRSNQLRVKKIVQFRTCELLRPPENPEGKESPLMRAMVEFFHGLEDGQVWKTTETEEME